MTEEGHEATKLLGRLLQAKEVHTGFMQSKDVWDIMVAQLGLDICDLLTQFLLLQPKGLEVGFKFDSTSTDKLYFKLVEWRGAVLFVHKALKAKVPNPSNLEHVERSEYMESLVNSLEDMKKINLLP